MTIAERRPSSVSPLAVDWSAVRDSLTRSLAPTDRSGRPVLTSLAVPIDPIDPIDLFAAARRRGDEPALWLQPSSGLALVGIGSAWSVTAEGAQRFADVGAAWDALLSDARIAEAGDLEAVGPLLIGGFGFADKVASSAEWSGFERARFSLHEALLSTTPQGTWLTLNDVVNRGSEPTGQAADGLIERWRSVARDGKPAAPRTDGTPQLRISATHPSADDWQASVARFAGAVGRGRLDKAVLTRQVDLVADRPVDVPAVLARLATDAPESTVFAITRGERTFLGATPERLIRSRGREVSTVAMAGSTRRGRDGDEDAELAQRLLESDKEREEHAVVVQMLRRTLAPLTIDLEIAPKPTVVRLRHVQHLVTPVRGRLSESLSIFDLVARLHPTPAVGGTPTGLALELIADEERHERGWYAGPIGWVDRAGDGEFAVALRSGVIAGASANLLAGCGIVADSDPAREWAESLVKLRALGSALGHVAR